MRVKYSGKREVYRDIEGGTPCTREVIGSEWREKVEETNDEREMERERRKEEGGEIEGSKEIYI